MTHAEKQLREAIELALKTLSIEGDFSIQLEHPNDLSHGDYSCNIALQLASKEKKNPREVAEQIVGQLSHQAKLNELVEEIEIAGPGFINFKLTSEFFVQSVTSVDENFGKSDELADTKAIVEYTDPNPFKVLHIGHLMSNTIGESLSRIIEWSGAETKRACYQGDVGMHVAKAIWGLMDKGTENLPYESDLASQVSYLGLAYAHGSAAYEDGDEDVQQAIKDLNKQIYEKSDDAVNNLYKWGRRVSLDYFETQYKKLGTFHNTKEKKAFDFYFFESEVGQHGKELVEEYLGKGVFSKSDGATVFEGEKYDLHTRVFLNSEGLPTYEAKELGLAKIKYDTYPYDLSVVVTGNEINSYFKVLMKVLSLIYPELEKKTVHVGHGMLRLPTGKMSSRKGTVLPAEQLISQAAEKVAMREGQKDDEETINAIAVGAIKFSILSQAAGGDIIFDFEKSLSFDGDSGPYLQYTYARSQSILRKAESEGLKPASEMPEGWEVTETERLLYRFPEIVARSRQEYSPHYTAVFLIEIARSFNSWYGNTKIVNADDPATGYRLELTRAAAQTIKNGLWLLGIEVVEEM